jgi:hypothetical protein
MSPNHLNNNLGKKHILEGAKKGIGSKQYFLLWQFFSILLKQKCQTTSTKDVFGKKKPNSPNFEKIK